MNRVLVLPMVKLYYSSSLQRQQTCQFVEIYFVEFEILNLRKSINELFIFVFLNHNMYITNMKILHRILAAWLQINYFCFAGDISLLQFHFEHTRLNPHVKFTKFRPKRLEHEQSQIWIQQLLICPFPGMIFLVYVPTSFKYLKFLALKWTIDLTISL